MIIIITQDADDENGIGLYKGDGDEKVGDNIYGEEETIEIIKLKPPVGGEDVFKIFESLVTYPDCAFQDLFIDFLKAAFNAGTKIRKTTTRIPEIKRW